MVFVSAVNGRLADGSRGLWCWLSQGEAKAGDPDKKLMPGAQQRKHHPRPKLGLSSHSKIQGEAGAERVVLGRARPS